MRARPRLAPFEVAMLPIPVSASVAPLTTEIPPVPVSIPQIVNAQAITEVPPLLETLPHSSYVAAPLMPALFRKIVSEFVLHVPSPANANVR